MERKPRQRKRGMGSIFKHGNSWWIAYYIGGKQVKERVGAVGVVTKGQAEEALKARIGEIVQGRFNLEKAKKAIIFDKVMDKYLEWATDNHKSAERDVEAFKVLLKYFGGKNVQDLTSWLVEKYKSDRKTQVKPATINRELTVLKRMFNLAIQWGLATSNPVQGVESLPVSKGIPRALKEWEFQKLYDSASPHFKPILLCAYLTGMRRSEIIRLKWEDVDFETGYIIVREAKNNEARAIPIEDTLKKELLRLKENATCGHVFTTPEGTPYKYRDAFKRAWKTALKKSGIRKCRFHDLRHTFTSNLIVKEKEDLITVSELTGHKDIRMLKRYGHTREEFKKEAIRKLGASLKLAQ